VEHPTWSPDGRSIAFDSSAGYSSYLDGDGSSVFIMNDDSTDRRHLVYGWYPAWSPGPLIAFHGSGGIEALGADGSGRRVVVPGAFLRVSSWTPNGGLLFSRDRRVFVSEGGTERQLIPDAEAPAVTGYWDSDAVWSR
jgi:hypothetical protein